VEINAFFLALFSDWVGSMSGLGSLIITAWIVLRPATNQRRAYALLALICFTTASVHIWTREHRARLQAEDGNEPALRVQIEEVMLGRLHTGQTTLTVVARAINHGAPSIYCFESLSAILPNGTKVIGKIVLPPPIPYIKLLGAPGTQDLYLRRSDYLNDKGIGPPISRGGATAGWVIVVLPNTSRESMSGGTRIVLEGRDAYGKMIVAETPLGNGKGSKIFNPYAAEDWNSQP
jgi:hypothetical protein